MDLKNTTHTHISILLDNSGSMEAIKDETINGLTEQIQAIKSEAKENEDTTVSFVTFGGEIEEMFFEKPVEKLDEIDKESYQPEGLTPMLDAVGHHLLKLKRETDFENSNHRYLVVIMSDGQENDSEEFSFINVSDIINELQETERWTFTYMGPMNEIDKIQERLDIPEGNISGFEITKSGAKDATRSMTVSTMNYMAYPDPSTDSFYEDDET